ncbi:MAG: hypothetical protein OEV28_02170 [Nitrospirota bacterium]|nr:hypothetical protein [Nitrospirota bacterium]
MKVKAHNIGKARALPKLVGTHVKITSVPMSCIIRSIRKFILVEEAVVVDEVSMNWRVA